MFTLNLSNIIFDLSPVGGSKFKQIQTRGRAAQHHGSKKSNTPEHTSIKNILLKKKRDGLFPYILYIMCYTM